MCPSILLDQQNKSSEHDFVLQQLTEHCIDNFDALPQCSSAEIVDELSNLVRYFIYRTDSLEFVDKIIQLLPRSIYNWAQIFTIADLIY